MKNSLVACILLGCATALSACGDSDKNDGGSGARAGKGGDGGSSGSGGDGGSGGSQQTLCDKYGGADNVEKVVHENVLGAIAGDCRINVFFTALSPDAFLRVQDCLTIQVQELFGCDGIHYAKSKASNGLACRSMAEGHVGLNISKGDFDALIEDVVSGLTEAGVDAKDIAVAAPALLGMEPDIVEQADESDPSKEICDAPAP